MPLRLIEEGAAPAVPRRVSDRGAFIWGVVWAAVSSILLIVFWALAIPVHEPMWTLMIFISCVASSFFLAAVSKIDATLLLGTGPLTLFIIAQSTSWGEAMAVWGSAYAVGACIALRNWADTAEVVSYLYGCALVSLLVLHWLRGLEVHWSISALVFVTVYLLVRLVISTIRLRVVTGLGLRRSTGHLLVRRVCLVWGALVLAAVASESLRQVIGTLHPRIDLYWAGSFVIFFIGAVALTLGLWGEMRNISSQLSGTLAAANSLPWSAEEGTRRHAVKYARIAFPHYTIGVQDSDDRNINEIISPLGDGYLVARRGSAQRPFLVQDQEVLDAIAHIAVTMDAADRERESLARSATTDDLTGLPNYRGFREFLAQMVGHSEEGFAVVYVDVDHFKEVNDVHGHEVGNVVLRTLATRLRSRQAASDLAARIGGDEFVLILTGVVDEADAVGRAQRLLREASSPIMLGDTVISLSLSSGVAFAEPGTADLTRLVEAADARMYAARGREALGDSAAVPAPWGGQDASELVDLINAAIRERRLTVMYQPIVDAHEEEIVGLEALVRPNECELEGVPADVIVHEAQRLGLLTELSIHVIETAVRDLRRFRAVEPELEKVNVNIDVEQVTDPVFLETMSRAGDACDAEVALELSETSLNRSSADLHRELNRLRSESSVKIALDDFGRHSSTLLSLLRYPADILKVDKALASDMHLPKQQAVMGSMVTLAQNLGLDMIVEGVEDGATRDELVAVGVRFMQGYYFGAPLTADALLERLGTHGRRARLP